jgi:DNA replication and repair protein RecF
VILSRVKLRQFRNLGNQDLELPAEGVAIIGANAQGKSNFLEAIYYLETFRSFRGARDDQILAFDGDVFRVAGELQDPLDGSGAIEIAAAYQRRGRRKKVTVNGVEPGRLGDALGRVAAVLFSPSDVGIVSEGPGERRRFLDIVLSLNEAGYLEALQRFRHVLAQRNAALRDDQPGAAVGAWNGALIRSGGHVIRSRARWIADHEEGFGRYHEAISGGRWATLRYQPNVGPVEEYGEEAVEAAFGEALRDGADVERRMRTTMVGPQRDDMTITVEGARDVDVRDYGSGGQRRTAALSLRLVEAATIRAARGQEPLVLMDDAFAELDADRSERILELMEREESGQVILTAPKESDLRFRERNLPRWRIEDGTFVS